MAEQVLITKVREILAETPELGYRLLHARLKEYPEFSDIGLKKVQRLLTKVREDPAPRIAPHLECNQTIPDSPSAAEIKQLTQLGTYSQIFENRLRLVEIPGRGKGYVAAKFIKQGEPLLFDIAFCSSPLGPDEYRQMAAQCSEKQESIFFKQEVMSLTCGKNEDPGLLGKLQNNVYQCTRDCEYSALFVATARFNHSCAPNAFVDCNRFHAVVRALQNIEEGIEVCTSYTPLSDSLEERLKKLSSKDFLCTCERCVEEGSCDPQFLVPCGCHKFQFISQIDAPATQVCDMCGSAFDRDASTANLQRIQKMNEIMQTPEAAQSDTRSLVKQLKPLQELCTMGTPSGAPPAHMESLHLVNSLSNLHWFCAINLTGDQRKAALSEFYQCKEQLMLAYDSIHGKSNQRDINFLLSLYRLTNHSLTESASKDVLDFWSARLKLAANLQFGQENLPPAVSSEIAAVEN